jgi:hypothetical protein
MTNLPSKTKYCATADYTAGSRQLPVASYLQGMDIWINGQNDGKTSLLLAVMRKKLDAVFKLIYLLVQEHYLGWTTLKLISKEWLITEDDATRVDLIRKIGNLVNQGKLFCSCVCVWGGGRGGSVCYIVTKSKI